MTKKISQLTAATSSEVTDDDLLVIVENASGATKKVTRANLLDSAVGTADIEDDAVTLAKIADSSDWQDWTPDVSAFGTLGNGTVTGRYAQIGKTVTGWAEFTLGSTSAVNAGFSFDLPVTPHADFADRNIGQCRARDESAGGSYPGLVFLNGTTRLRPLFFGTGGTYGTNAIMSNTVPFTWGNTDSVSITFTYEAE